jgi:hypothetical protein
LVPASQSANSSALKTLNIAGDELNKPEPISLEDIRLEDARRRLEAREAAVQENLQRLEEIAREIKQERSYERL